jgi:hypothetical protein
MPTYEQYCAYAAGKKFQALGELAFQKLAAAGFNPIGNEFELRPQPPTLSVPTCG